tara:strand:+ start:19 stop:207 length:189 start_codon:yes stop_codon:yes gene_type:complete
MMRYKIVTGGNVIDCQQLVNVHMIDGWLPQGGPFTTLLKAAYSNRTTYQVHQAMTQETEENG